MEGTTDRRSAAARDGDGEGVRWAFDGKSRGPQIRGSSGS